MVTHVEFRYGDWSKLLTRFSQSKIGRAPEIRINSPYRVVAIFNPALTPTEKNTLNNALPEWIKFFFDISLEDFE